MTTGTRQEGVGSGHPPEREGRARPPGLRPMLLAHCGAAGSPEGPPAESCRRLACQAKHTRLSHDGYGQGDPSHNVRAARLKFVHVLQERWFGFERGARPDL